MSWDSENWDIFFKRKNDASLLYGLAGGNDFIASIQDSQPVIHGSCQYSVLHCYACRRMGIADAVQTQIFVVGFISAWMITMFVFVAVPRYHYVLIPFFVIAAINLLQRGLGSITTLPLRSKLAGLVFTIFLLGVWISEFYLLYFRTV